MLCITLNLIVAGVNHAYVTTIGRLIGVVGLKELRKAIEDVNHRHLQTKAVSRMTEEPSRHDVVDHEDTGEEELDEVVDSGETVTSVDSLGASSVVSSDKDEIQSLVLRR